MGFDGDHDAPDRLLSALGAGTAGFSCQFERRRPPRVVPNAAFERMLGYTDQGSLGEDSLFLAAIDDNDRPSFLQYVERLRTGPIDGSVLVACRFRHRDGSKRVILCSPPEQVSNSGRAVSLAVDITALDAGATRHGTAYPATPASATPASGTAPPNAQSVSDDARQMDQRFEAAIRASQVVVFNQGRDLRYTWIHNPALGKAVADVIGKRDADLFERAEDAERLEAIKQAVLDSGIGQRQEVLIWHEGVDHCYDLSVQPQRDQSGGVIGVTCAAVDITARRRAEDDLAFLAELGEAFVPIASSGAIGRTAAMMTVRHFRLSRCLLVEIDETGQQATVFYDCTTDDAAGSIVGEYQIRDFHSDDERLMLVGGTPVAIDDVRSGQRPAAAVSRFDALHIGAILDAPYVSNGRCRFVLAAIHSRPHAWRPEEARLLQEIAARTYLRLERVRSEEALRAAHDTFSHLVEHSPFGIYAVDADFRLVQVSHGARKVFENVRPLIGRDFGEILRLIWPEPFASEAIAIFRHTLETGEPYHAPSTVERRQDIDAVESYDWKTERLTLPDGRPGVVCHFYDLSERQSYEAALREADRQKDEFLAVLAHELRNPLAPIRTAVAVLRQQESEDPVVHQCRQTIERQTAQMARLLDDLLDVSRLSRGQLTLQRAPAWLDDVVAAAVETSRPSIDQHHHELTIRGQGQKVLLDGDAARLTQVFANLLNNAAKFSRPGSRIDLDLSRNDSGQAVVVVRDAGIGIAPEMIDRVFDLFVQAPDSGSRGSGGLGIGLSLARRLVDMHGGTLTVVSGGLGQGSAFTVTLPAVPLPAPAAAATSDEPAGASLQGSRVVVVDDNQDAADVTAMLLEAYGCEVKTAYRGSTALALVESFRPHVVLLDLGLPEIDGFEVCRRVRALPGGETRFLVAVSGWGRSEDRQKSAAAGFDAHLTKPVDPDAMVTLIRGWESGREPS